jgi:hypothetical protein
MYAERLARWTMQNREKQKNQELYFNDCNNMQASIFVSG